MANMSGVGALYSTPVWSFSPADLLFLSVGPVDWTLGFCLYTFEARRREGWKQWLWPGVWPAPSWVGGAGPHACRVWVEPLSESGPSVGLAQIPVILGRSGQNQGASPGPLTPHPGASPPVPCQALPWSLGHKPWP